MVMLMENQQQLARMSVVPAPPLPPPPPPLPSSPQAYNHRCKVCKKGFMCGRALGGHMRAHGVTDDGLNADDDSGHIGGTWHSAETGGTTTAATKRMYPLSSNAGRHICGEEFTSSNNGGRCSYDSSNSNIIGADVDGEDEENLILAGGGWSRGKRTRRTKIGANSREDEDGANSLVMLASPRGGVQAQSMPYTMRSKHERTSTTKDEEGFVVPQPISVIPHTVSQLKFLAPRQVMSSPDVPRGFECKGCKKVFTSHQALGGHRASHKKVKGCFAAKLEISHNASSQPNAALSDDSIKVVVGAIPAAIVDTESNGVDGNAEANTVVAATSAPEMPVVHVDETPSSSFTVSPLKKEGKVHECSICHRVFISGQALGGHKRCHWLTTGASELTAVAKLQPFAPQDHAMHAIRQQVTMGLPMYGTSDESCLDLNVPMNQYADPAATRQAAELNESMLSLNPPVSLYMHSRAGPSNANNMHDTANGHYDLPEATATEDEEDSTSAKRAKISDLKDMNMAGETSQWLQVGIALPPESNERLLKPKG